MVPEPAEPDSATHRPDAFVPPPSGPSRRGPGTYDRTLSTEERREEQRRQLVAAAAKAFAQSGYAKTSVASILEISALSRGTFYRHFRDLREVFLAVQEEAAKIVYERVHHAFQEGRLPPEQMRSAIRAYLELLAERSDFARVLYREARVSGDASAEIRQANFEEIVTMFRRGGEQALSLGLIQRLPDDLTVYALVMAIVGVGERYLEEGRELHAIEAAPALERLCFKAFQ